MYILILILFIFLIINNCIHYDYFTIGNISISKKLNLDTSMCKTCRDRRKKVSTPPDDPCINKEDIKKSGYDTDKYDKIVTDTEFRKKECCCTDETNCDPTTLARYDAMTCNQYERLDLDNDVCKTDSYDGYDYLVRGSKTIDETSDYYSTLTFNERVQGWNTFYTYRPDLLFSLKNNYFTTKEGSLYIHYDSLTNANEFYGVSNQSSITFIFNPSPSINKNFKTINYEGSNGWQVDSFVTDAANIRPGVNEVLDQTNNVKSYDEGLYTENGIPYRAGFVEKENKYYANLVNNSTATSGEVVFGDSMTGVKGYFATVKMSTDLTTNAGGTKEMFAVSSEFVVSSQ